MGVPVTSSLINYNSNYEWTTIILITNLKYINKLVYLIWVDQI